MSQKRLLHLKSILYVKERYSRKKGKTEVHRIGPKHSARLATLDHTKGLYKEMTDTPVQFATVAKEAGQIQRDSKIGPRKKRVVDFVVTTRIGGKIALSTQGKYLFFPPARYAKICTAERFTTKRRHAKIGK